MDKIIALLKLTKPGVLIGNVLTVPAGYFLASAGTIDWVAFLAVLLGSTLIIASACVLNNYLDQDIDRVMERTRNRPLIQGHVSGQQALIFCIMLALGGFASLWLWTNIAVVLAGAVGFITYVWLYGAWTKRQSVHGTLVGSISGAIPILAGYLAVSGQLDLGAVLAFMVVFLWQQPEFYSISIYRKDEYQAAGLPVMAVSKGAKRAKIEVLIYIFAFGVANILLTITGYAGYTYAVVLGLFCLLWLTYGWVNFSKIADIQWGKKMFRGAMIAILLVCIGLPFAPLLP